MTFKGAKALEIEGYFNLHLKKGESASKTRDWQHPYRLAPLHGHIFLKHLDLLSQQSKMVEVERLNNSLLDLRRRSVVVTIGTAVLGRQYSPPYAQSDD
jgi:hypothetical protein